MADSKISALPASTVPLAGTEVLPIVQSSTTKQVSVANLTAGRAFDALSMTLTSTDAGAGAAPLLDLYRDSASPAASDTLGEIEFNGEDSAGNKQQYALIHASILSPTSGSEQGQIHFETATAGASTEKMIIGTSNLVINEIGAVFNVRIEGDTDANLLYTDATNDRIGIGTASPTQKLHVASTTNAQGLFKTTGAGGGSNRSSLILESPANTWYINTNGSDLNGSDAALGFYGNSTTRMVIDSTGSLLVGTTSNSFGGRVIVSNDGTATQTSLSCINTNGSGTMRQIDFFTGTNTSRVGSIESTTTLTAYNVSSDYRLKEDIAPMTGALAKIAQLKPVTYKWKINGSDGQGFIAHELAEVVPDCVSGEKDAVDANGNPDYQGVDTSFLIATLTSAIQEQQALIESLSARLTALESN